MDREDVGIGLLVLGAQITARRIGAKAARIDAHHVDTGLALGDPLRQLPAGAAGSGDTEAVAFVEPEIVEAPGRADHRRTVRRVGYGAVIDLLHANLGEGRDAGDGGFDIGQEAVHVFLEQLEFGLGRGAVEIAAWRADFIRAEQQAAIFLAHIPG